MAELSGLGDSLAQRIGAAILISIEPTIRRILAVWFTGAALAAVAVWVTMASDNVSVEPWVAAAIRSALIVAPVSIGLYAWSQRPTSGFAWILTTWGLGFFPVTLNASSDPVVYTAATAYTALPFAFFLSVQMVLRYPHGRLESRAARTIALGSVGVGLLWIVSMFFNENPPTLDFLVQCGETCPDNLLFLADRPVIAETLATVARIGAAAATFAIAILYAYRLYHASRPTRRRYLPVAVVLIVTTVAGAAFRVAEDAGLDDATLSSLAVVVGMTRVAVPFGILAGMIAGQMFLGTALARVLGELDRHSSPDELERALADALSDESLAIGYWLPNQELLVDSKGRPLEMSSLGPQQVATEVKRDETLVAVVIHDRGIDSELGVVEAAASASLLALENARLEADLRASIVALQASRARIVSAADIERQRIERDLHDGAQARLIALRIDLEFVRSEEPANTTLRDERLVDLGAQIDAAMEDLRRLARGIYPPLLTDHGLDEALQAAALHASIPTRIEARGIGRYQTDVESAVYFCCLEALQNVGKHAGEHSIATVRVWDDGGDLCFEIVDTGTGFDSDEVPEGVGLRNMRDRLGAVGGAVDVASAIGEGTVVSGRVPTTDGNLEV